MVAANHAILVDPWWNRKFEEQAEQRIHRIGQTKEVTVIRFIVKDSIEERMLTLHKSKECWSNLVVNCGYNQSRKKENVQHQTIINYKYLLGESVQLEGDSDVEVDVDEDEEM